MGMQDMAADVAPPYSRPGDAGAATVATKEGVVAFALAATSQRYTIPASWRGKIVTFYADGQDFYIVFGDGTVVADLTAVSTVSSEAITYIANTCFPVPSGSKQDLHVPVDATVTSFAIIAVLASGKWRAYPSTGKGQQ